MVFTKKQYEPWNKRNILIFETEILVQNVFFTTLRPLLGRLQPYGLYSAGRRSDEPEFQRIKP